MPQNLICRHTVGAVAAQPDREARGPALGTRGKCPGAARELRGTRKRHTGKNGILPSGVATYNDSAVASSGVSGTIVSHRGRSGRDARWRRAVRVAHVFGTCETAAWAHVRLHVIGGRYAASSQGLRGSVLTFWLCCLRRSAPDHVGVGATTVSLKSLETAGGTPKLLRLARICRGASFSTGGTTTSSSRQRLGRRCQSIGITGLPV